MRRVEPVKSRDSSMVDSSAISLCRVLTQTLPKDEGGRGGCTRRAKPVIELFNLSYNYYIMSGLTPSHDIFGDKITMLLTQYCKDKVYKLYILLDKLFHKHLISYDWKLFLKIIFWVSQNWDVPKTFFIFLGTSYVIWLKTFFKNNFCVSQYYDVTKTFLFF